MLPRHQGDIADRPGLSAKVFLRLRTPFFDSKGFPNEPSDNDSYAVCNASSCCL